MAWAHTVLDAEFAERVRVNDIDGAQLLDLAEEDLADDLKCHCPRQRATILEFTQRMSTEATSETAASTGAPETPPTAQQPRARSTCSQSEAPPATPADAQPESRPEGSRTETDSTTYTSLSCTGGKKETPVISTLPYYIPRAMPVCDSPDPRSQAEEHLRELAKQVREHPILPIAGIT